MHWRRTTETAKEMRKKNYDANFPPKQKIIFATKTLEQSHRRKNSPPNQ